MADDKHSVPDEVLPYGGWPSIIDAASVAAGATSIGEPRVHAEGIYWLENRPGEGGRTTLLCHDGTAVREVTPAPWDVRSRVHEYGGGAYLPTDLGVFLVSGRDQNVYLAVPKDGGGYTFTQLTEGGAEVRYGDLCLDSMRRRLMMVCERHDDDGVRNTLETLDLESAGKATRALHQGRDFYAAPRLSADGARLAFLAWDHPNMPWDGTELLVLDLDDAGDPYAETLVAGGAAESVLQPVWTAAGALLFASDASGYWNLYRFERSGTVSLLEDAAEYAEPPWLLAGSSFTAIGERYVAAVRRDEQQAELVLVDAEQGFATPLPCEWQEFRSLTCRAAGTSGRADLVFIGSRDDEPAALVRLPLNGDDPAEIARATMPPIPPAWISRPEALRFPTRDGAWAYAWYYPPTNPEARAPATSRPPLLVVTHGGPTGRTSPVLNLKVQFFTSRGFAVVDVDYRGSSGYGRAYRRALDGRWGVLEVNDCEDVVNHLANRGLVDPRRVAIRGGSAGGFTTLSALTRSRTFSAGASYYGIGDLVALARETHKFESRYLHTLVGDDLEQRSPIRHVDDLRCPVIFFQGGEDRVVPPGQARAMVEALDRQRLPVAYVEFPDESHGFLRASNIERALTCEYTFYCRVFGIDAADPPASLEIRNL